MKALKLTLKAVFLIVLLGISTFASAQSACPAVTTSPNVSMCSGCTTLTATIQGTMGTGSYSVSPIAYAPYSFTLGTSVLIGVDDQWSNIINMPFCFEFYGNTYNSFVIGSNGLISFDVATYTPASYCQWPIANAIPSTSDPMNSVMGVWEDIDPTNMGTTTWQLVGTAPCRAMVISWAGMPYFGDPNSISTGSCPTPLFATYQIVLNETTNIIDINVLQKELCTGWNGGYAIEGLHNLNGTLAVPVPGRNYPATFTLNNDAQRFMPTGPPNYTFGWYQGATLIGTNPSINVCPTSTTTYTAQLVNNTCGGPITVTSNVTVTIGLGTPPVMTSTPASCSASNGTATATPSGGGPFTYIWTPTGQTTQTATGLAPGTYTVTVTDGSGCSSTVTVAVASGSGMSLSPSSTPSACSSSNGSATITATGSGPFTYVWTPTGQTTATATGLPAGSYSVTVTDVNGCTATSTITVTNSSTLTSNISSFANVTCNGAGNGSATVNASSGTAPYTYAWSPVGGTNATANNLAAGTYTVTVTDANGCISTQTVTITEPSAITAPTTQTNITCFGGNNGTATVTPAGGTPGYTYNWLPSGGAGATANNLTVGTYTVTVTDLNGCTQTATVTITEPTQLTLVVSSTTNTSCGLNNGSSIVTANGGTTPYTYAWTPSGGTTTTATGLAAGNYTCTVTDANGCSTTATTTITPSSLPPASFTGIDTTGCSPVCVTFTNTSPSSVTCLWNFGDGFNSTVCNPVHCYTIPGTYNVTLTITDASGCTGTSVHNGMVQVYPSPVASFSAAPQPATEFNPTVYFTDQSSGLPVSWQWNFGDPANSTSTVQNPSFTYLDTGYYVVQLVVANTYGCTDTFSTVIRIQPEFTFYAPTAFSPNGDGFNDVFTPKGTGIDLKTYELMVFDRWGAMIFKSNDLNIGWNGHANGGKEIAQIDTYVWKVKLRDVNGAKHSFVGHVNIIK